MKKLTNREYWEKGYEHGTSDAPLHIDGFRNLSNKRLVDKLLSLDLSGNKEILEIGAGNSAILTYLAKQFERQSTFSGLDYSETGCSQLSARAHREKVSVNVYNQDMFNPDARQLGRYDVVYSIGVVEHFSNLPSVLMAKGSFLKPDGIMFTLIPNMAGILGYLTKTYNRGVYEMHNPHDLNALIVGHKDAGFKILSSGYLCSSNFGVISSCFANNRNSGWHTYLWLTRLSKLSWLFEQTLFELPHTALISPYIYVISRRIGLSRNI